MQPGTPGEMNEGEEFAGKDVGGQPCFHLLAMELGLGGGRGEGEGVRGAPVSPCVGTAGAWRVFWGQGWQLLVVTPIKDLGAVSGISWIMLGWGWIMPRESHPPSMAMAPLHVHIP